MEFELRRISIGYRVPEKLIKVFERTGFKPIMRILEKKIDKEEKKKKFTKNNWSK